MDYQELIEADIRRLIWQYKMENGTDVSNCIITADSASFDAILREFYFQNCNIFYGLMRRLQFKVMQIFRYETVIGFYELPIFRDKRQKRGTLLLKRRKGDSYGKCDRN